METNQLRKCFASLRRDADCLDQGDYSRSGKKGLNSVIYFEVYARMIYP